jgi:hypothetical protein
LEDGNGGTQNTAENQGHDERQKQNQFFHGSPMIAVHVQRISTDKMTFERPKSRKSDKKNPANH